MAIQLILWEAVDSRAENDVVPFSMLFQRIGVRDSGQLTCHLYKLTGHLVEKTDDGYQLRNAVHEIVQAVIAGAGFEDRTRPPTEIDMSCYCCGAPVELTCENEHLYLICYALRSIETIDGITAAPSTVLQESLQ